VGPFCLVICSYALLMQDADILSAVSWNTLVLDEAQAIKNWSARRTQAAMSLQAGFCLATTGTPLENNLNELWTLFRFLNPGLLGPRKRFHERFALPIQKGGDQEQKKVLKRIIRPFILRRLKSQVMEELPPRTEVTLNVRLSDDEAALYEAMRRQALENLESNALESGQKHLRILAELTKLRQMCCHPRLVFPESEVSSSKLALLEEIVAEIVANGHKALIFSQFVSNLQLVRDRMHSMGLECRYLDGSTPRRVRDEEIAAFQSGQGDVFLISLRAGGMGINLTAADYVIHLDPWWNPAVEDQAADRAHRIGQDRPVTVYRLVTEGTVEEKIVQLHGEKRDLADSLLEGSDVSHKVDAEELMQLLRQNG
jgi:SNF2 family DNA or RNA helicase